MDFRAGQRFEDGAAVSMTGWSGLHVFAGAAATEQPDGALVIETPRLAGAYAAVLPVPQEFAADQTKIGFRFIVTLEVIEGALGLFASRQIDPDPMGGEVMCTAGVGRVTVRVDGDAGTERLCIRSGPSGACRARVELVRVVVRRCFDITAHINDLLPVMLVSPGPVALSAIAGELSRALGRHVDPDELGELSCREMPVRASADRLWNDEAGKLAASVTQELVDLLPTYDPSKMNPRHGYRGRPQSAGYLKQSVIRVYHLMQELERRGVRGGTLLEVGALFGQFALTFHRLGYDVTCIDRYRAYDGALDGFVAHLRREGVTVIEADRETEQSLTAALGRFDVVLAMAVIEHVPHTAREFLTMLGSHVQTSGILAIDTPNIARYWNRRRLATGLSVHQAIDDQFYSGVPYEGHHREFTAQELRWMLEQLGACDVETRLFDYNLLQFPELWTDQLRNLLTVVVDPSQADTVLAAGRLDRFREPHP